MLLQIHEARPDREDLISSDLTTGVIDADHSGERRRIEGASLDGDDIDAHNDAIEIVADSNDVPPEGISDATVREDGDAEGVFVSNTKGSCWTRG